jgi:hypothetical protein
MLTKQPIIHSTSQLPLIIYYQGNYEDIPTENIISIIEANEIAAKRKNQLRKVMFLSVEAIQNVQRYSAHKDYKTDFYLMFYDGDSYQVSTQNLIYTKDTAELQKRLDGLIDKSSAELEELYMATVDAGEATLKGAGLGLIEITRKSNKAMRYDFKKVDEEFSLFSLYFAIPLVPKEGAFDFSKAIRIQNELISFSAANESSFYYGGDFSNTFILSLLSLFLSKKAEQQNNASKTVHHILIELIQNIKKHARSDSGITPGRIFIEWKRENIEVTSYNLSTRESIEKLKKKIVDLNNASKEQLIQMSKEMLMDLESTNGLGLIDIANLIHPNKMNVSIGNWSNGFSELFFNIKINNGR